MIQRYKKSHTLSLLWFSSIDLFFLAGQSVKLSELRFEIGHLKEGELFPEHSIISTEVNAAVPQALVHYHLIRRIEKYTFSTYSDVSFFRWNVLECFINEFLPEMDTYKESKLRHYGKKLVYRRRGRCLEFVRLSGFKTARTTYRRDPYPFSMQLSYYPFKGVLLKNVENYFRMFRLPVRVYKKINRWWLAKKYWDW